MAKYSGSTTMELRKTPLQDKNSEYLIILAEALARGSGKRSKLVAICDFMEKTAKFGDGKQGIDTVHFASVNKVGKSGVIDIAAFETSKYSFIAFDIQINGVKKVEHFPCGIKNCFCNSIGYLFLCGCYSDYVCFELD